LDLLEVFVYFVVVGFVVSCCCSSFLVSCVVAGFASICSYLSEAIARKTTAEVDPAAEPKDETWL
jgi:hypothetical protein